MSTSTRRRILTPSRGMAFAFTALIAMAWSVEAMAVPVTIDPGLSEGRWRVQDVNGSYGWWSGEQTVDLEPGRIFVSSQHETAFYFDVDASGLVTPENPVTGVGGQNEFTFNTVAVEIDAGNYDLVWNMGGPARLGSHTVHLVPGVGGAYTIGTTSVHGHVYAVFGISVDDAGNAHPHVQRVPADPTPAATLTGPNQIALQTAAIDIDPNGFLGRYYVLNHGNLPSTPHTMHLLKGLEYGFYMGRWFVEFQVADDGLSVVNNSPDSLDVAGTAITFRTTPITFDPQAYAGRYYAAVAWGDGPRTEVVVNGLAWYFAIIGNAGVEFEVDAAGATSDDSVQITTFGQTVQIANVLVPFDTAGYTDAWRHDKSFASFGTDPSYTLVTVPGINDYISVQGASPRVFFSVTDSGEIVPADASQLIVEADGSMRFNTYQVEVDPGTYQGTYQVNGLGWTYGSYGPQTTTLIAGLDYRVARLGIADPVFSVYDPCAVNPNPVVFDDGVSFGLSCDVAPPDGDGDGVPDDADNCPTVANADQIDLDQDGAGDLCDNDVDGDGVDNGIDNCPELANADQADADGDYLGDVCDADADGDDVADDLDNCPTVANTDQGDNDADGAGDLCDGDDDNDGIDDVADNCVLTANADQADFDGDGEGDACDGDSDGDGIDNVTDRCADTPAGSGVDAEGCNGAQYIGLTCDPAAFANHGRYVSCVAHAANDAVDQGLITAKEKARFVKQAAKK